MSPPPTIAARAASSASSAPPAAAARAAVSAATCAAPYAAAVSPMPSATATPSPPPCAQTASASALNRRRPWSLAEPVVGRAVVMAPPRWRVLPLFQGPRRIWENAVDSQSPREVAGCRPCRTARAPVSPPAPRTSSTSTPLLAAYPDRHPIRRPGAAVRPRLPGHRGSSLPPAFNDDHIAATTQAIFEYRAARAPTGPLYVGADSHALSGPAWLTACEALAGERRARARDSGGRLHPHPRPLARRCSPTTTRRRRPRGRHRHHSLHNPPDTGASSTTRQTAARPTPTPPNRRRPRQPAARRRVRRGAPAPRTAAPLPHYDFHRANVTTCRTWWTSTRSAAGLHIGADPLGGASVDDRGRSPSATAWTSPWSTQAVDRSSGS